MSEFYVEGFTAEGAPYGPVLSVQTPLERDIFEEILEGFDALKDVREEAEQAREDAWRESEPMKEANAVMSAARRERGKHKGEDIE